METKQISNLSRTELFEALKEKCKSNAKRDIYSGLTALIIALVVFLFHNWQIQDDTKSNIYILWIVIVCLSGWTVLHNYLLLSRIDNLNTPDKLLSHIEKKQLYNLIGFIGFCIFFIVIFFVRPGLDVFDYVSVAIWTALIVSLIVLYFNGFVGRRDKVIIELLRELVKKK